MTPIRLCIESRCPNEATGRGRCDFHRKALERERSRRRREATKGTYKKKLWLTRRRQVLSEEPICTLCGERLSEEVDHVVPLSRGGAHYERDNLRGVCRGCHIERHRRDAA